MNNFDPSDYDLKKCLYKLPNNVEVHKIVHKTTGEKLCMKKIYVDNIESIDRKKRECSTLKKLNHPNIIKMHTWYTEDEENVSFIYIIMDFYEEGDLMRLIGSYENEKKKFSEQMLLAYLKQLVSAYAYMQREGMAHRDIKPGNILVSDGGVKLIVGDLGSAVVRTVKSGTTLTGTSLYLSPILKQAYYSNFDNITHNTFKSDVYSLGLTFLRMASIRSLDDLSSLETLQDKLNKKIKSIPDSMPTIKTLLTIMLSIEEDQRPDFIYLEQYLKNLSIYDLLKCHICQQVKSSYEVYVLDQEKLCNSCYQKVSENIYPKYEYYHYENGSIKHKINEDFSCICNKRFCYFCKDEEHRGYSCAEFALYKKNNDLVPKGVFKCSCEGIIMERTRSHYVVCRKKRHRFCLVCGLEWNQSAHEVCMMLFISLIFK